MPVVELPKGPERFDTINLQAEIKKNIDEIMKATDTGEVSENIGAIKNLVEEIPYLQVKEEPEVHEEEFSVNETFNQYLREGMDGQISLLLPDDADKSEEQIEGQLTIEDVLAEWEKTKRAAEAAMEEAKSKELENARAKALREAKVECRVVVGGAVLNQNYADMIGADAYCKDAMQTVRYAEEFFS